MNDEFNGIPIIKFWDLLLVPLQGEMTDDVAGRMFSEVLERIHQEGSSALIIDITGLWLVDSHLCSVLSQLAAAASLMGANTIISGMKPEIAMVLETMGIGLENVTPTLDLETALDVLGVRRHQGESKLGSLGWETPDGPQELASGLKGTAGGGK